MRKLAKIISNKYVISTLFFVVWMLFFDARDLFNTLEQKQKMHELLEKKKYYESEIEKARSELTNLQNNPSALEKFARERYKMKKDGEDIFIVDDDSTGKN